MDKNQSVSLKAFAVVLMFWHHLFGCDTFLTNGIYYPYFSFGSEFEIVVALGGKLCISLFAFASGYGLYKSYVEKANYSKILTSIFKFLMEYWVVMFVVAIPYLLYFDKFNLDYLLVNLFTLLHNDEMLYVSLSWYVKVHLGFLIMCPLMKYVSSKCNNFMLEIYLFIVLPRMLTIYLPYSEAEFVDLGTSILSSISLLCRWLPVFYVGVLFAKYGIIEKIRSKTFIGVGEDSIWKTVISLVVSSLLIISSLYLRCGWGEDSLTNSICVIVFLVGFDELYYRVIKRIKIIEEIVVFVGKYSFQFWLLSGMFFLNTTEFTWLLYLPKYKILICIWNFVILIPLAVITKKVAGFVTQIALKNMGK